MLTAAFREHKSSYPPLDERPFTRLGWLVILVGLLSFVLWGIFAPLDKGIASSGTVIVYGHRKTVQAPVNGKIKRILVKEGEDIRAGQTLIELDQQQALAQLFAVSEQYFTLLAIDNRLKAERDGLEKLPDFPLPEPPVAALPVTDIIDSQRRLFQSRRAALHHEITGYRQSEAGTRTQLKAMEQAEKNRRTQLLLLQEQINRMKDLVSEGYYPRNHYSELLRQAAEISSSLHEIRGRIGELQKNAAQFQLRVEQSSADYLKEVHTLLEQTKLQVSDYKNKVESAKYTAENTLIRSPSDGTVIDLALFTPGGVISYGEHLMDIVPRQEKIVVEARLNVELIDKVHEGLPVKLRFTAFNQSITPEIPAVVTLVSADRLTDKTTGMPFYRIEAVVAVKETEALQREQIKPGMPVELFIKTGSRSLFNYLFKPFSDRMKNALSEE